MNHVTKTYGSGAKAVDVIHGISVDIADGEFMVMVGPSGCGKSTLLRMVAGLEEITGGDVVIGDLIVNALEPKDRDIAMVFQNYALYPHMSVYQNMAYGLKIRRVSKDEIETRVQKAPPMNLWRGVTSYGAQFELGEGVSMRLPIAQPALAMRDCICGVRPEHLTLGRHGISMEVELVEALGAELLVHARAGGQALVLRAPARTAIAAGQCVTAGFDAESVHWFDAHTTQRLE